MFTAKILSCGLSLDSNFLKNRASTEQSIDNFPKATQPPPSKKTRYLEIQARNKPRSNTPPPSKIQKLRKTRRYHPVISTPTTCAPRASDIPHAASVGNRLVSASWSWAWPTAAADSAASPLRGNWAGSSGWASAMRAWCSGSSRAWV